jgi:pentatricopeptide repeat protein
LTEIKKAGLSPSDRTYSILIHLFARMGRLGEAFAWLERMREAQLTPNAVTFSTLIHGCGRAGKLNQASTIAFPLLPPKPP